MKTPSPSPIIRSRKAWEHAQEFGAKLNRRQLVRALAAWKDGYRRVASGEDVEFPGRLSYLAGCTRQEKLHLLAGYVRAAQDQLDRCDALIDQEAARRRRTVMRSLGIRAARTPVRAPRRVHGSSGRPGCRRAAASSTTSSADPGDEPPRQAALSAGVAR